MPVATKARSEATCLPRNCDRRRFECFTLPLRKFDDKGVVLVQAVKDLLRSFDCGMAPSIGCWTVPKVPHLRRAALVQSCLFEANSFKPVMKNQWLASPNFPDLCTLHQSPTIRLYHGVGRPLR